ncbi:uracil-DNA glycosylase [Bacillus smithii]|uniref:uracil-DNA glycosylase n=2 Tax=Bacillus smithii TaxID=1479 RepID=UPI00065DEB47|nr:uracil-DNA glycosylase [Bacillus smithii]AKP48897.1 Uracil-DNA glycosylasefamily 1 [Bacillus smithii]MED4884168.1 uracil-DNA glycosylase [Bacillus smithii]MED4927321.1 uracil-DNA glycosylase [Bacillus smithii]
MKKKILSNDWAPLLEEEFEKEYYLRLREFLKKEYQTKIVYPDMYDIFNALHFTPYKNVKVVLLGQDPYHGPNQAHGLSFSVKPNVPIPPSLKNIFQELHDDLGCYIPDNGCLIPWARQGVLLLNTVLTVRQGEAHSHRGKGWEQFTDRVISLINNREKPAVFILWGRPAQSKLPLIDQTKHFIIRSPHPSPLSANRGFFGSRPFSKANRFLREIGETEIDWQIPNLSFF